MQRDMDLIRELLLKVEADPTLDGRRCIVFDDPKEFGDHTLDELTYHVDLLLEAGFVKGMAESELPMISRLTWDGHEFLDNTRDPEVWGKVKDRIKGLASVGLKIVAGIAEAELRKNLGL